MIRIFRRSTRSMAVPTAMMIAALAPLPAPAPAQATRTDGYHDHTSLTREFGRIAAAAGKLASLEEIARSPGGRTVQALILSTAADGGERPALLVVGNAYGPHVLGSEIALAFARRLAEGYGADSAISDLLDRVTVYIIPRANPDAAEAFFESPLRATPFNAVPFDDDRDGTADEDGPEDLNGDGFITMMRVADPAGEWVSDSADSRLMRKARATEGERGEYRLLVEGIDNDHDERWNEDGPGGVDVNMNFPYGHAYHAVGAGLYPMAASEARAVGEFFVAHPNIAAVYVPGPQDNVREHWKYRKPPKGEPRPGTSQGGPLEGVTKDDAEWFEALADGYRGSENRENVPESAPLRGDVLSFSYFDMGRWAVGTRAWWVPVEAADSAGPEADGAGRGDSVAVASDTGSRGKGKGKGKGTKREKDRFESERRAVRWIDRSVPGGFVPWTEVDHPDFPGRTVEVGGFRPFVRIDPPAADLDSVAGQQVALLLKLAGSLPRLALREVRAERVDDGVYRVTAQVVNEGFLPTSTGLALRLGRPRRVRVDLEVSGQRITAGRAVRLLDPLGGSGGHRKLTWLLVGKAGSRVVLRAGSPTAGTVSQTITLR